MPRELIKQIMTDVFMSELICSNISARIKFWTESSLVTENLLQQHKPKRELVCVGNIAKRSLPHKNIMLCIWCDCHSIIHKDQVEKGKTITSKVYSEMFRVDDVVNAKLWNEFWRKKLMLHKDNARPHVSTFTVYVSSLYSLSLRCRFVKDSNSVFCHTHHIAPTLFLQTSAFFHPCIYILLALSLILQRAFEMKLICFCTLDNQVFCAEDIEKLPKRSHKMIDFGSY